MQFFDSLGKKLMQSLVWVGEFLIFFLLSVFLLFGVHCTFFDSLREALMQSLVREDITK
jgi:hypothetical protein